MGQTEAVLKVKTEELNKAREEREAASKAADEKMKHLREAAGNDNKAGVKASGEYKKAFAEYKAAKEVEEQLREKEEKLRQDQAAAIVRKKQEDDAQRQRVPIRDYYSR